ncbi:MAG: cytochrome c oxidase subunit 3, partial [Flavobacteriales bacterium]
MEQTQENTVEAWKGGDKPFVASYGKLMMWFFLITDALTFSAFLGSYGFYRFKYPDLWPVPEEVFTHFPFLHGDHPLLFVALMTFILIMSSVTMVLAVNYGHKMQKKKVILWLSLTIVGGFMFLGSQAWEWGHFIHGDRG